MARLKRPLAFHLLLNVLTMAAVFVSAPIALNRRGNYWYGAAALFVLMALPIAVYLCLQSVHRAAGRGGPS